MPNEVGVICLAEAGEEQVQYELAMKYYFGVGTFELDQPKAERRLRRAAAQGFSVMELVVKVTRSSGERGGLGLRKRLINDSRDVLWWCCV